jgi:hypothetical protein
MEVVKGYKDPKHSILMVGPGKAGKSTLSVNLFGRENTVVIAYDRKGLKSVGEVDALLIDPKNIWTDTIEALQCIRRDFPPNKKSCIVVNDMTFMSRMLLYAEKESKDNRKRYALAIDKLRQFCIKLTTEFTDYHIIAEVVDQLIRDDNDNVGYTAPSVIGKDTFALELPGMFDHVFYVNLPETKTTIVNGKPFTKTTRTILTQSVGGKQAGNRMNIVGEPRILDISEEVMIEDGSFANIDKLRKKLLGV